GRALRGKRLDAGGELAVEVSRREYLRKNVSRIASRRGLAQFPPFRHEDDHTAFLRRSKFCKGDGRFLGHGMSCCRKKEAVAILAVLNELARGRAAPFLRKAGGRGARMWRQALVNRVPFRFLRPVCIKFARGRSCRSLRRHAQ